MKRHGNDLTSGETTTTGLLLHLPRDLLAHIAAEYLPPLARARYRLVCHRLRAVVQSLRQQLHWYCLAHWSQAYPHTSNTDAIDAEWVMGHWEQYAPALFRRGRYGYVMCVIPNARLVLCGDNDEDYRICCDGDERWPGPHKQPNDWWWPDAAQGRRPRDLTRRELTLSFYGTGGPEYHLRFMYHPAAPRQ
jgi:hypothetical protein